MTSDAIRCRKTACGVVDRDSHSKRINKQQVHGDELTGKAGSSFWVVRALVNLESSY